MGVPSNDPQLQQRCLEWGTKLRERIVQEQPDMVFDGTGRSQLDQYKDGVVHRFN